METLGVEPHLGLRLLGMGVSWGLYLAQGVLQHLSLCFPFYYMVPHDVQTHLRPTGTKTTDRNL